jgi:hypothetical protein
MRRICRLTFLALFVAANVFPFAATCEGATCGFTGIAYFAVPEGGSMPAGYTLYGVESIHMGSKAIILAYPGMNTGQFVFRPGASCEESTDLTTTLTLTGPVADWITEDSYWAGSRPVENGSWSSATSSFYPYFYIWLEVPSDTQPGQYSVTIETSMRWTWDVYSYGCTVYHELEVHVFEGLPQADFLGDPVIGTSSTNGFLREHDLRIFHGGTVGFRGWGNFKPDQSDTYVH